MTTLTPAQLNKISTAYQRVAAEVRVEQYDVPQNLAEEARLTRDAYERGARHDPHFTFKPVPDASRQAMTAFAERISEHTDPWLEPLRTTVDYVIATLRDAESRAGDTVTRRTQSMYGSIAPDYLAAGRSELQRPYTPSTEAVDIDASTAIDIIQQSLELVGLAEWRALVDPSMNAMMDVSGERQEIRIRTGTRFSRTALTRLLVHEVGCHVFRCASGARQPIQLLGFGLGDYLATEEGLACYQEELTGIADPVDSRRLALRYLAASLALESSLFDVYAELRNYADHDQAFETAARAKRGIADTSKPGCHLKDKVYFEGIRQVTDHLSATPGDIVPLYAGKISLRMLPLVKHAIEEKTLRPPAFTHQEIPRLLAALSAAAKA